jgi:hypothetical protein
MSARRASTRMPPTSYRAAIRHEKPMDVHLNTPKRLAGFFRRAAAESTCGLRPPRLRAGGGVQKQRAANCEAAKRNIANQGLRTASRIAWKRRHLDGHRASCGSRECGGQSGYFCRSAARRDAAGPPHGSLARYAESHAPLTRRSFVRIGYANGPKPVE